ncbi:MaoC family dehydratase [Microbulbifer sp. OS29]|uniref:MaoC family dehydratase n=1 Tax=Microbulbifer okhotskensis TaxID=2926617 RepID=A0A9X2ENP6_9GAMM|nr:MaoC family dehydratase [Microbulbifer okhotskensis]MCO1335584.1 MaoC family dehydratase [Microbulbifer okhotskensis]
MPVQIIPSDLSQYIGLETEPTAWFEIDQQRIDSFAECTMDRQFIHVDPEAARKTPFGGTIAHGFLTLSLLPYFIESLQMHVEGAHMGVNYGLDKVRFIHPVKTGSRVRVQGEILEILEKKEAHYQIKLLVTMEIEGEKKPALIAEWIFLQIT